jgi:hypothetical protein
VLDPAVEDFKPSSLRYLDRADAVFLPGGASLLQSHTWPGVSPALLRDKPAFPLSLSSLDAKAEAWLQARLLSN